MQPLHGKDHLSVLYSSQQKKEESSSLNLFIIENLDYHSYVIMFDE